MFHKQRVLEADMEIRASDDTFYVQCESGNLQGVGLAALLFVDVYHPAVIQWHQRVCDPVRCVVDPISFAARTGVVIVRG